MTTLEPKVDLPDRMAQDGMQPAITLLAEARRRIAAAGIPPMSMDEINAEVKAAREELQQRAERH